MTDLTRRKDIEERLASASGQTFDASDPIQIDPAAVGRGLRDVGVPMGLEAILRMTGVGNVGIAGSQGVTEFGLSKSRGESTGEALVNSAVATSFGIVPFIGNKVKNTPLGRKVPQAVKSFFSGERTVGRFTRRELAQADRVAPDEVAGVLKSALSGRQGALKAEADTAFSRAVSLSGGPRNKTISKSAIRDKLEAAKSLPIEDFDGTSRNAVDWLLNQTFLQGSENLTLNGANQVRRELQDSFRTQFVGAQPSPASIQKVAGLIDEVIEGALENPEALAALRKSRRLRALRRSLFEDSAGKSGKPNLARFLENENKDVVALIVNGANPGDFRQMLGQIAKSPNADEGMNAVRSILLDTVDEMPPSTLLKALRSHKSPLRAKLDRAFYPGFHREVMSAARDASVFARAAGRFRPAGSRLTFGTMGVGGVAGRALGLDPATSALVGAATPLAGASLLGGAETLLGTGLGRRTLAASASQGARAEAMRRTETQGGREQVPPAFRR